MLRTCLDRLYLWAGYAAGFFLVLIFVLMMALSVGRQIAVNVPSGDDFAAWSMAACAFLGLAHTFKNGDMIRVGLVLERLHGRGRQVLEALALAVAAVSVGFFGWYACVMTYDSWRFDDMSQGVVAVPLWFPQLGMASGIVILFVAVVDEFVRVLGGERPSFEKAPPATADELVERIAQGGASEMIVGLGLIPLAFVLLGVLVVLLAGGVWIALGIGAAGFVAMMTSANVPIGSVLATTTWSASASWTLAALPLFIWMGEILFRTRLSEQMFRGLSPWLQWLPGRLIHVNVVGCGIFAAVSGSSAATCATIGKIALPELEKRGYDPGMSLGSLAGAGTLGLLIPPSIPMVVYAVTANVSVIQVFLAGFIPGLLVMALYSGYIIVWSLLNPAKTPPRDPIMPFREKLRQSAKLLPCLLLIVSVFLALILGFATATECAAWGVTGALALAWWSGTLTTVTFFESLMSATRLTCMIMLILTAAAFCTAAMAYTGIPTALADWVQGQNLTPHKLVLALTVMYIILGCLIDGISMIVLTAVIVLPMVKQAGFDLIWFGVYLIIHVEMAQITPPVGFNLFVLQNMSGRDSFAVAKAAFPFFLLLNVAVIIITTFPSIVTFLPRLAFAE